MPDLTERLRVGGIQYYIHDTASMHLMISLRSSVFVSVSERQGNWIPCTVINWPKMDLDIQDLDTILNDFALQDDVWNRSFLDGTIGSFYMNGTNKVCCRSNYYTDP